MGQMRYWLTVVLMLFTVEANGQDMTRDVGDFIAIYTDCEYEKEAETMYFYKCEETKTTSLIILSISIIIHDYETFDQVWAWSDLGKDTNYAIIQHEEDDGTAYYEIFYFSDIKVLGIRRIEDDNLSEEP